MAIAERLKALRLERGLSQAKLAAKTGITKKSIINYENECRDPNSKNMARLEQYFNVSGAYLRGETDDPSPMVWQDVELLQEKEAGITTLLKNIQRLCADPATPEAVRSDAFDILQLLYSALRKKEPAQQREAIRRLHDFAALSERYTAAPAQPPSE